MFSGFFFSLFLLDASGSYDCVYYNRSHVWGHFCLSYNEYTLTNDKACLRNFGIKDGDQVSIQMSFFINFLRCALVGPRYRPKKW